MTGWNKVASWKWCPNKDLNDGDWSASVLAAQLDYKTDIDYYLFQLEL